jgi:hypothetical protein
MQRTTWRSEPTESFHEEWNFCAAEPADRGDEKRSGAALSIGTRADSQERGNRSCFGLPRLIDHQTISTTIRHRPPKKQCLCTLAICAWSGVRPRCRCTTNPKRTISAARAPVVTNRATDCGATDVPIRQWPVREPPTDADRPTRSGCASSRELTAASNAPASSRRPARHSAAPSTVRQSQRQKPTASAPASASSVPTRAVP